MLKYNDNRFKYIFAHSFFVKPADTNYLLARYTKINFIFSEFFWQSAQTIEKLLKASLILNGQSSKNLNHNLNTIWNRYTAVYKEYPIKEFEKPDNLQNDLWNNETLTDFINRINQYGDAECRYGLVSYHTFPDDLFKLDYLIFQLRKRVVGLNWTVGRDWETEPQLEHFKGQKYLKALKNVDDYKLVQFEPLKKDNPGTALDVPNAYYCWNFYFSQEIQNFPPAPLSISSPFGHMRRTTLQLLWEELSSLENAAKHAKKISWILQNVKLKNDDISLLANKVGLNPEVYISK